MRGVEGAVEVRIVPDRGAGDAGERRKAEQVFARGAFELELVAPGLG